MFILFAMSIIGSIGGIICTIVDGAYTVAIGILSLSFTAWPAMKKFWKQLNG